MLALLLVSTIGLLALGIALSAHWFGHIRGLNTLVTTNAEWLAPVGLLFLFLGGYCFWRSRRGTATAAEPAGTTWHVLAEDSPSPAGILRGERVIAANQAFWRYVGISRMEPDIVGVPFASLVNPYEWKKLNWLKEPLSHGVAPVEMKIRRLDGASVVTKVRAAPINYEGSDALLIELAQTVGPQPSPTASAGGEQGWLIVNSIEQVVFQTDAQGCWIFLNPSWKELTGFPVAASLGKDFLDYVHPQESARSSEHFQSMASRRKSRCWYETRLMMADGGVCWVEVRIQPMRFQEGKMIGMVGTFTDITKRKSTEESLRTSRRTLTTLLGDLPAMVSRSRNDRNWTMEFVSDGCFELTGYEAADLIDNQKLSYAELIHPDDRDYVWRNVQGRVAQDKAYELTYRIITATGATKWVWERGRGVFSAGGDLLALEGFMTDITVRKQAEDDAKRDLFCDPLTKLSNSAVFHDRLAFVHNHSKAGGYPFALLYVDLDNFKSVNLDHGRAFGDKLLVEIAGRLKSVQRAGNTVARIDSDEFAVLISDLGHPLRRNRAIASGDEDVEPPHADKSPLTAVPDIDLALRAVQIAERLQQALAQPILIDGQEIKNTASIGIALSISAYEAPEKMFTDAAGAAHRAKFLGESRSTLADQPLHAKALGRRHIESSLTYAFGSNALRVLYQPVVTLDTRRVAWLEAVMYWQHPRRGLLDFEAVFGIAEDAGLLMPITRWMLRETSAQLAAWRQELALGDGEPRPLCISLHGKALADANVVKEMVDVMGQNQGENERWIIQVRDISDISYSPEAQQALLTLKSNGIRIAVSDDDNAPGGPLNVKTAVADIWKVNVGLINKERNVALLRAMSGPDRKQRLLTVATGIQSVDTLNLAIDSGFVYGQGPLFGEPVSAESVRSLMLTAISPFNGLSSTRADTKP